MGLVFSIFCFVHLWVPRRLNIKPKLSPLWQTGLQAQARGPRGPVLPSGHQETTSVDLWGRHPWHLGFLEASSKLHRDLCRQAPGGQLPKPAGGENRKNPSDFSEGTSLAELGRGAGGPGRGQVELSVPLGSSPAGIRLFPLDGQSRQPSQGTLRRGKGRTLRQRVRSVDFPFPAWQRGEALPVGASGRRCRKVLEGQVRGGGRGGGGGHLAPRHSQPLYRQHQRVTARHCHHGEGHMWVSAGSTGRE